VSKISVDITIPVLNEEHSLPRCIATLTDHLTNGVAAAWDWNITIADNGSEDSTPRVGRELSKKHPNVRITRLDQRGRGRALKKAWMESDADVRCFMDVDLSTRLGSLEGLVDAVAKDGFGVAIGSRLLPDSRVEGRTFKREVVSRSYNALIRLMFPRKTFRDAQCGFKAVSREVAQSVVPHVENTGWFFDTELLLLSLRAGYQIKEIPVHWVDDPDTRVRIFATASEDIKGLLRVRFSPAKVTRRRR
jgi:glycosyltransferase involved in cell wall biosynthesis